MNDVLDMPPGLPPENIADLSPDARDVYRMAFASALAQGGDAARASIAAEQAVSFMITSRAVAKYDPDQPRRPKGDPEGGQWTAAGGGGVTPHLAEDWSVNARWSEYQHAARAVLSGVPRDEYVCYDCYGDDGLRYDRAAAALASINKAPTIPGEVYRGLYEVDYKVGDVFSESLTSWTGDKSLAHKFAGGHFAGDWDKPLPLPGASVLHLMSTDNAKGVNLSDLISEEHPRHRAAQEWLTSGQYEVVSVERAPGQPARVFVKRIGPAVKADLKKAYDPNQPRRPKGDPEGGQWTDEGGSADARAKADKHFGRGWWFNAKTGRLVGIDPGDLGPHGDHDGWITVGDNATRLGVDENLAAATQVANFGGNKDSPNPKVAEMGRLYPDYLPGSGDDRPEDYERNFERIFGMTEVEAMGGVYEMPLVRIRSWPRGTLVVDGVGHIKRRVAFVETLLNQDPTIFDGVKTVALESGDGGFNTVSLAAFMDGWWKSPVAKAGFDPSQPRHPAGRSEGGRWVGDMSRGVPGDRLSEPEVDYDIIRRHLPKDALLVVDDKAYGAQVQATGGGLDRFEFKYYKDTNEVYFGWLDAGNTPEGRLAARGAVRSLYETAAHLRADKITMTTGLDSGGYVWPRLGFQVSDTKEFLEELGPRLKRLQQLEPELHAKVSGILAVSGSDAAYRLSRLDDPLDEKTYSTILGLTSLGGGRGSGGALTLGKAMLLRTSYKAYMPSSMFSSLKVWSKTKVAMNKTLTKASTISIADLILETLEEDDSFAKHYPGGRDHDQRRHGRRGALIGDEDIVAWHGTSDDAAESIREEGLRVTHAGKNFPPDRYKDARGRSVFVTEDRDRATFYANVAAARYPKLAAPVKPVLIELRVPSKEWATFKKDTLDVTAVHRAGDVPASWIAKISTLNAAWDEDRVLYQKDDDGYVTAYAVIFVEEKVAKYDPDQPRKPKGDPEGGQWTPDGAAQDDDEWRGGPGHFPLKKPLISSVPGIRAPAIMIDGVIVEGYDHLHAMERAATPKRLNVGFNLLLERLSDGQDAGAQSGFTSTAGKFLTREEAARLAGVTSYDGGPASLSAEDMLKAVFEKAFDPNQPRKPKGVEED